MVTYERTGACAHSLAASTEIREVRNAGESNEHLLPPGRDSGYLWRANTFTRFVERDGNVYVELETIGLTRAFPKLFGWIIEPIARRIGRNSVERTLTEFRAAVHASVPETVSGVAAGPRISARGRVESPTRRASGFAAHGSMASHAHGKTGGLLARHSPQKLARKAGV
jgi:hypothetical protein